MSSISITTGSDRDCPTITSPMQAAGALYLQTPGLGTELWLADPRPRASVALHSLPVHQTEAVQNLTPGEIIMFPAWVPHGVPPTNSGEPRVTVAFNVGIKRECVISVIESVTFALLEGGWTSPICCVLWWPTSDNHSEGGVHL